MISEIAGPIYIGMTLGLDSSKVVNTMQSYKLFGFLGDVGGI